MSSNEDLAAQVNRNLDAVGDAIKAPWPAPPASGTYPLTVKTRSDLHHVLWFATDAERGAFVADMNELDVLIRADGYDLDGEPAQATRLTAEDLGVGVTDDGEIVLPQDYQ